MFSPEAFSGYGFGSGAPSADSSGVDAGAPSINPDLVAALQGQLGGQTPSQVQGQYGRASYPGGSSLTFGAGPTVEAQAALDAADEAGRGFLGLGRGSVMQDPYTGQVTTGTQYSIADLAQLAGGVALPFIGGPIVSAGRQIADNINPYETQLEYGYERPSAPQDNSMEGLPGGDPRTIEQRLAARRRMEEALAGPQQPGI